MVRVILTIPYLCKPPRGGLPVLSINYFTINRQMIFLNQLKRKNGRRNIFTTKSSPKNVPDAKIDHDASCIPCKTVIYNTRLLKHFCKKTVIV